VADDHGKKQQAGSRPGSGRALNVIEQGDYRKLIAKIAKIAKIANIQKKTGVFGGSAGCCEDSARVSILATLAILVIRMIHPSRSKSYEVD
jgi:hypothetical protein